MLRTLTLLTLALGACQTAAPPPGPPAEFADASTCATCHPMQAQEWRGSVMHYAAASPVFNAFELTVQKLTEGGFSPNSDNPNFCNGCHTPIGVKEDQVSDFVDTDSARSLSSDLDDNALDGLTCDFCHTVSGPDLEGSLLGDGIANLALTYAPSMLKQGPLGGAQSPYHVSARSTYLQDPAFCGACHDVRLPVPDVVTGEPFQRLENLFTEWETGPYNSDDNPHGKVVTCQDCHMSLYPMEAPGTYPTAPISAMTPDQPRRHALHAFTAVSIPLVDSDRFPTSTELDGFGYPLGQAERRTQMLQAAATLEFKDLPTFPDSSVLPVVLEVVNTGAGHRVPSGFSQEREVWIQLVVRDDVGLLYRSGYLVDQAHPETGELEPDGLLHDEDLNAYHYDIDLESFATHQVLGPDRNLRPDVNLGLMNFQNAFIRVLPDGTRERVLNPLEANTMDNSHSLPILEPVEVRYDIPLPRRPQGPVQLDARLRYRSFPPEFLRFLAQREPDLVSEATVDANTIVDMAEDHATLHPN